MGEASCPRGKGEQPAAGVQERSGGWAGGGAGSSQLQGVSTVQGERWRGKGHGQSAEGAYSNPHLEMLKATGLLRRIYSLVISILRHSHIHSLSHSRCRLHTHET